MHRTYTSTVIRSVIETYCCNHTVVESYRCWIQSGHLQQNKSFMSSDPGWDCLRAAAGFGKQLFVVDGVVEERARRSAQRHRQRRQQRRSWRRRSVVHRSCATFKLPRRRRKTYRRYFGEPAQTKKFTFGNVYASVLKCVLGCDFGYVFKLRFQRAIFEQ